jgi:hypothetical protein
MTLDPTKDAQKGFGFSSGRNRSVLMEYSPKIQRNDFLRLPWGVPPNSVTPVGLSDGTPPSASIALPGSTYTSVTFTWVESTSLWTSSEVGNVTLVADSGNWRFQNSEDSVDLTLGAAATTNPFAHYLWGETTGYGIPDQTLSTKDYRVVWENSQYDDFGDFHHTSLVIELEDVDT